MNKKTILPLEVPSNIETKQAFDIIFSRYYVKVKLFVLGFIKDKAEADDIAQDIFLKLWVQRYKIGVVADWDAYFYKVARNSTLNALKAKHKKQLSTTSPPLQVADYVALEDIVCTDELQTIINNVIKQMPPQRSKVFTMSRVEGLTNQEIATALNISKRTVETHITAALNQIKRILLWILLFSFV